MSREGFSCVAETFVGEIARWNSTKSRVNHVEVGAGIVGCAEDVVKSLARLRWAGAAAGHDTVDINNVEVGAVCDTLSVVLQQELVVVLRMQ